MNGPTFLALHSGVDRLRVENGVLHFNDRSVGPTLSQLQYFVRVLSEVTAFMEMVEGHLTVHGNNLQP